MKHFQPQAMIDLTAQLAVAAGLSHDDAEIFAAALVDADVHGVSTHGLSRLNIYLQRIDKGLIAPRQSWSSNAMAAASWRSTQATDWGRCRR